MSVAKELVDLVDERDLVVGRASRRDPFVPRQLGDARRWLAEGRS